MTLSQLRRIRWAVRGALVLAIAASVAANVLHAEPNPIAQTIAAWPPVALLITLELVVRIPVARRLGWLRAAATAVIAGIAAWVSYWHMAGVAARYGEDAASSRLLPLSVDGLIVVASVSLVELAARIRVAGFQPAAPEIRPSLIEALEQVDEGAEPPWQENGHDPARARRIKALADLAAGAEPKEIAAAAGVTLKTLRKWADDAAGAARLPRGRPRRAADIQDEPTGDQEDG